MKALIWYPKLNSEKKPAPLPPTLAPNCAHVSLISGFYCLRRPQSFAVCMLISPLFIPRYFHLKPLAWERERRTLKASRRVTVHRWWSLGIIEYIEIRKSYIRIWEKYRIRGNLCTGNLQLEKTTCHGEPESEFYSK